MLVTWEEVVNTNCFEEHGAINIYPDPWQSEKASLEKCKNHCLLHRLCSGIVWDTQQDKCHLRKDIQISKCDKDNGYNLYKLPGMTSGVYKRHVCDASQTTCHALIVPIIIIFGPGWSTAETSLR